MINLDEFIGGLRKDNCNLIEFKRATADRDDQNVTKGQLVNIKCELCYYSQQHEYFNVKVYDINNSENILWENECEIRCSYEIPFTKIES